MNTKGQKLFSIVNIIMGVILTLSGFIMFSQPDTFPGPLIVLPLGLLFWIWGAAALRRLREGQEAAQVHKTALTGNKILFLLSCIFLCAVVALPIIAPRL